jgi:hypothetical protein
LRPLHIVDVHKPGCGSHVDVYMMMPFYGKSASPRGLSIHVMVSARRRV